MVPIVLFKEDKKMDYNVKELVSKIDNDKTQAGASAKDEVQVMRAMLNDKNYKVDVYSKNGKEGEYCPRESAESIAANILKGAAKITGAEAVELASNYEFSKSDAEEAIKLSKEFINTYTQTGRKINLGGREKSNVSLKLKHKEASTTSFPRKTGVDSAGKPIYEKAQVNIPAYDALSVSASAPEWLK